MAPFTGPTLGPAIPDVSDPLVLFLAFFEYNYVGGETCCEKYYLVWLKCENKSLLVSDTEK